MNAQQPNRQLLAGTLEHIEAHPEEWHQGAWLCGTAACFAGRAVLLHGGVFADSDGTAVRLRAVDLGYEAFAGMQVDATVPVSTYAQVVLGLNGQQAEELFAGDNSLAYLRSRVHRLMRDGWSPPPGQVEAAQGRWYAQVVFAPPDGDTGYNDGYFLERPGVQELEAMVPPGAQVLETGVRPTGRG